MAEAAGFYSEKPVLQPLLLPNTQTDSLGLGRDSPKCLSCLLYSEKPVLEPLLLPNTQTDSLGLGRNSPKCLMPCLIYSEKPVLEPLLLPNTQTDSLGLGRDSPKCLMPCLLCEELFKETENKDELLKHLLVVHKLVIADVKLIANLKSYLKYWKHRFKDTDKLEEFCSVISTTQTEEDGSFYYLLSDVLDEDRQLREFLQKRKLEHVLQTQQKEREDCNFSRGCLFCKEKFYGNRSLLFNHMAEDHGFNVGQPDNLVFTDEFLDVLEGKLSSLQCLYCEKTFRDKIVLKEHMRKKQHRKINPVNKTYDKFYVINYLEVGKTWENIQHERDTPDLDEYGAEVDDEWTGWEEEISGQVVCLFCEFSSSGASKLQQHMLELHDFDLQEIKLRLNLNFYHQVKLVNFIRRQVHLGTCIGCQEKFDTKSSLNDHLYQSGHCNKIPERSVWDQPQYFFPTYENDNLLCQLEDEGEELDGHVTETVIAEDTPFVETILSEEKVRQEILTS